MTFSRRRFLHTASGAAAAAWLPSRAWAGTLDSALGTASPIGGRIAGDPDLHALAARAVDAARSAGASYADVRFTDTEDQLFIGPNPVRQGQNRAVGVRVLVNGFWGFQGSTVWTVDEVTRLSRDAVAQAKANGVGKSRRVELGPPPAAVKGDWVMPVKIDPFDVPLTEKMDYLNYASAFAANYMVDTGTNVGLSFSRQRKVFASSDGSAWSQTTYLSGGGFSLSYRDDYVQQLGLGGAGADFMSPAGKGWEHISESGLIDQIPRLIDEAEQSRHMIAVEVDRYDTVFSASAMAALLDGTLGAATELDRAMGFEANADGTSYLNEPLEMLGTFSIGNPLINVTANRSLVGGAATVKWDDEGVTPEDFTIVKDGTLVDYQTTREQADWLAPYYQKTNHAVRSHGCASAESAMSVTMQHSPNLQLMPGSADTSFDDLVASVKKGVAVLGMRVNMDQQQLNGLGYPVLRKITNGKLGPYIVGGGVQFRSPETWKNLSQLGGAKESRWFGFERGKGQPYQRTTHSVGAVPARINNVNIIDIKHKA